MIQMKVSMVLLLQDNFDGRNIANAQTQFYLEGQRVNPLRKREGYYVFTMPLRENNILTIRSYGYQSVEIPVPCAQTLSQEMLLVRLERSVYVSWRDCLIKEGTAKPNSKVYAYAADAVPIKFQTCGTKDGAFWVLLQGYTTRPMLNRRFCVTEGKNKEYFVVVGQNMDGTLALETPLRRKFKPGSVVNRVYDASSDATGAYHLFIESDQDVQQLTVKSDKKEGFDWLCKCVPMPK